MPRLDLTPSGVLSLARLFGISALILALAWQTLALQPTPGLDPSWMAGLAMAAHDGIQFGKSAIFTYGPLGFLANTTLWYDGLGVASVVYALMTRFLLALALYTAARRSFRAAPGFVVAVIVASVVYTGPLEPVIALFLMTRIVSTPRAAPEWQLRLIVAAAAASAGFELMVKISIGATLAAMTAVFILSLPGGRRARVAFAVGAFVISFLAGWLLSGQSVGAIPDYVRNSAQIVSGYAAAMSVSPGGLGWQATAAVFTFLIGLWGALQDTADLRARQRWGAALLWVAYWYFLFKDGFVRHDAGHAEQFFTAILGGFFAFRWRPGNRVAALLLAGCLLTIALAAQSLPISTEVAPLENVTHLITQLNDIGSSTQRTAITEAGRAAIRTAVPLSPNALALLRGHTAAVYPNELSIGWAYRLRWDPLPVLQSYSAYTTSLDAVDANSLSSRSAPERIVVFDPAEIDGRFLSFDQPQTARTILCHYRQVATAPPVAILARISNRCSPPIPLRTVRATWNQTVPIPSPPTRHSLVFVRIDGVGVSGIEQLRALVFKPRIRSITLNGSPSRLVPGTATDGLPLLAASGIDFSPPFNIAPDAHSVAVSKSGQPSTHDSPITFSFYTQTVSG